MKAQGKALGLSTKGNNRQRRYSVTGIYEGLAIKTIAEILAHLIFMAKIDKRYAWSAAKWYAALGEEYATLPDQLTAAMKA